MAVNTAIRGAIAGVTLLCCAGLGNFALLAAEEKPRGTNLQPIPEGSAQTSQAAPPAPGNGLDLSPAHDEAIGYDGPHSICDEGVCWGGCCLCGPANRFWLRADYLVWWVKGGHLPPLVTTGTVGEDGAGILGQDHTRVLFGDAVVNGGARSGFRVAGGGWLNPCQSIALQGDYFDSGGRSSDFFSGESAGDPVLARPFTDFSTVATGEPSRVLIAIDNQNPENHFQLGGSVRVHTADYFQSAGATLRPNLWCRQPCCEGFCGPYCFRLDMLAGYRYYRFSDSVVIRTRQEVLAFDQAPDLVGARIDVQDSFLTRNEFHGGELGLAAQLYRGCWSLEFIAKVALGNNRQLTNFQGSTIQTLPSATGGPPAVTPFDAGLLVNVGNAGRHFRDDFVAIPQFEAQLGYQLTCRLRTYVGYNFLYWYGVARAGELITTDLNSNFFPASGVAHTGEPRPLFAWHRANLLAQGLSAGLEYCY